MAPQTAEVKRMYVVPKGHGIGLARAMLDHLEETARAAGAEAMVLETGLRQPEAIALYVSAGYVAIAGVRLLQGRAALPVPGAQPAAPGSGVEA